MSNEQLMCSFLKYSNLKTHFLKTRAAVQRKTMTKIPKVTLSNGQLIPAIGFGTYARNGVPEVYRQATEWAIDTGYRHIDTAAMYNNEVQVGEAIANKIKEGVVRRDELFVTTKLLNDHHAREDVVPGLKGSLSKLKLDYVDLYLVHWPISVNEKGEDAKIDYVETWRGIEDAIKLGLTKSIGISNFNEHQLERLMKEAVIKPVVHQFEINPTLTQHHLVDICKKHNVQPVAYTPLGLLSGARPEFAGKDQIKTDPKLEQLALKYGKSKAQVALKYLLQRGIVVIPKSFTKSRIAENLDLFDFELSESEMSIVDGYNIDHRCVPGLHFNRLTNYPF